MVIGVINQLQTINNNQHADAPVTSWFFATAAAHGISGSSHPKPEKNLTFFRGILSMYKTHGFRHGETAQEKGRS